MKPHELLATTFLRHMADTLDPETLAEIDRRNAIEETPGVCHSHDFCDANTVMAPAFHEATGREVDIHSDEDLSLWQRAWNHARTSGFSIKPV